MQRFSEISGGGGGGVVACPPVSATGSFNRSRVLISELQEDKQNPTQLRDTRIYEILFSIEAVN